MERLCVAAYEASDDGKKRLHDSLVAYAIFKNSEIIIKWLKTSAKDEEIVSAFTEAQMAFVNTADVQRASHIGNILYQVNPTCALTYYGDCSQQDIHSVISYFTKLFPSRPILYLDRPREQEFYQTMCALHEKSLSLGRFIWETKGMQYRVPWDSILYFRSERNYVFMRLKNGTEYSFLGKLANMEQMLPGGLFVRVHQSYLVNKAEILLIDKQRKAVHLSNGEDIFISKAHYKETKDGLWGVREKIPNGSGILR